MIFCVFIKNMRYSTLIGFLVTLLKQLCTSEGGSTPIRSSTEVTYQDGQTFAQEPELPAAEVMPLVSPPSLKEVQRAVQEASEQVYGHGAEEVLKELLERVVEAAVGHTEGEAEAKDAVAGKEVFYNDAIGVKTEEHKAETEAEILEQTVEARNVSRKEGAAGFEEREGEAEANASEDVAVGEMGVVKGEGETPIGPVEKSTEGVETRVREAEGLEAIEESLGTKFSQEDKERVSKEAERDSEAKKEDSRKQVVLSVLKNATETEIQGEEKTAEVPVDVQPEQETVHESKPGLGVGDDEQIGTNWGKEAALKEETQIDKTDREKIVLPSEEYEIKISKHVTGGPVEVEREVQRGEYAERHEEADENGHSVDGENEEMVDIKGSVDEGNGKAVINEESVALLNEGSDIKAQEDEEEKQISLENLPRSNDPETSETPGLQSEDSTAAFIENQPPTPDPSVGEVETEENTLGDGNSHHDDRIITPTRDFLPHSHGRIRPTLDLFENVLAEYHQAEGGEPGETNELVESRPGVRETNTHGLEGWKIGAIFAAVFLVVETVVIVIYILKCRNKKSSPAVQQACEEGCVEPEAATGGDCSDDAQPTGDAQQMATLDVASTLGKKKRQQETEQAVAMSKLSPGPGPDPSQDFRTSV